MVDWTSAPIKRPINKRSRPTTYVHPSLRRNLDAGRRTGYGRRSADRRRHPEAVEPERSSSSTSDDVAFAGAAQDGRLAGARDARHPGVAGSSSSDRQCASSHSGLLSLRKPRTRRAIGRPTSRSDHRAFRGISRDALWQSDLSPGNMRRDRRGGTNPARLLRGAFRNGTDPLSDTAPDASDTACAPKRTLPDRPSRKSSPITASGNSVAFRSPIVRCSGNPPRTHCVDRRNMFRSG